MKRRRDDAALTSVVFYEFSDTETAVLGARYQLLQEIAAVASKHLFVMPAYVVITPLGMPHREVMRSLFQASGITISRANPIPDWDTAAMALRLHSGDPGELRKALAYEKLWRRESAPVGEHWELCGKGDYDELMRQKYQLRRHFPRRHYYVQTPAESFHAFLHSFWLPESGQIAAGNLMLSLIEGTWST